MIGKEESKLEGKPLTWKFNEYEVEYIFHVQRKQQIIYT